MSQAKLLIGLVVCCLFALPFSASPEIASQEELARKGAELLVEARGWSRDRRLALFNQFADSVDHDLYRGEISYLEAARRKNFVIRHLAYDELAIVEFSDYVVMLEARHAAGEMSREELNYHVTRKQREITEQLKARERQERIARAVEAERLWHGHDYPDDRYQQPVMPPAPVYNPYNDPIFLLLKGLGDAFSNTYQGPSSVICRTGPGIGIGSIQTVCY